jgi:hypothetical protein
MSPSGLCSICNQRTAELRRLWLRIEREQYCKRTITISELKDMPIKFTSMEFAQTRKMRTFVQIVKRESEFPLKNSHKKKAPKPSSSFFSNQSAT